MPVDFQPPRREDMELVRRLVLGTRRLFDPVFLDLDKAPTQGPRLFVANHSLYAMLDFPQIFHELYEARGIFLRSLGHSAHFKVPFWGPLMEKYGAVEASRENCAALFDAGEAVLVFPGGGREAAKRKGEKYKLIWKERLGFARMAIRHGATIVPMGCFGAEDAWDIVKDGPELLEGEAGPVLKFVMDTLNAREDESFPLIKGIGPTPIPRPVRLYFSIADPIPTGHLAGLEDDDAAAWALRRQVEAAITGELERLRAYREQDPDAPFSKRLVKRVIRRLRQLEELAGESP